MNFSFSDVQNSQNADVKPLEGNKIYEVTFDGCEARDFAGKQDASKTYKVLEIKFSNSEGAFTHTIWQPRDEDFEDRTSAMGYKQPANALVMVYLFKHLLDAVNPEASEKINKGELKLDVNVNNWDSVRKFMVEQTNPGKGKTTKIKLIKNNKGEAIFPYFLSYSKENKPYMTTNFIGNGVYFTTKELDKISKANNAKPTNNINELSLPKKTTDDEFMDDDI